MNKINILSVLLFPFSLIYGLAIFLYARLIVGYKSKVKLICIGNITMGGNGKTPMARAVVDILKGDGYKKIVILLRGYGGSEQGPVVVDVNKHNSFEVGDEPLMLAGDSNIDVVVAKNKKAGVKYAESLGADVIVMDDGLQNPTVKKDKTIIVVDGYNGFGNGFVFPAGSKREFILNRLAKADVIVVTASKGQFYNKLKQKYGNKVYFAEYKIVKKPFMDGVSVVPFSGLANNEKFFETVRQCGYPIRAKVSYPDHHEYTDDNFDDLQSIATKALAQLVTTEKDFVRLNYEQKKVVTPLLIKAALDKKINL